MFFIKKKYFKSIILFLIALILGLLFIGNYNLKFNIIENNENMLSPKVTKPCNIENKTGISGIPQDAGLYSSSELGSSGNMTTTEIAHLVSSAQTTLTSANNACSDPDPLPEEELNDDINTCTHNLV
jgi:hypothetical protein